MREMAALKASLDAYDQLVRRASDAAVMLELADESGDESALRDVEAELRLLEEALRRLELELMFSGKYDHADAILTIQPAPAAWTRKTGPRCFTGCICAGPSGIALR